GVPIAIGTDIWPHGRWRMTFTGEPNHAGTTRLADRRDPVVVAAECTLAIRSAAAEAGMVATVGRLVVEPNSPNAIAGRVTATVDARAADDPTLDDFVTVVGEQVDRVAAEHRVDAELVVDSRTAGVAFDERMSDRIEACLTGTGIATTRLPTAAGHDAGILAAHVPSAMLFVRNPTGASHTPSESATVNDCVAGVAALTTVLEDLAWA
ncbi:MAG: M20/M25/M40 family metallo-hydrolase, partial [Acidimicrobiales bacterium]